MRKKRSLKKIADEIEAESKEEVKNDLQGYKPNEGDFTKVISTGSTLLDLEISGRRIRGGGIPGGVLLEVAGDSQTGKSAILGEIAASCQANKGEVRYDDPEGRLDEEYSKIYGMEINKANYDTPDTVSQVFRNINHWEPKNNDVINVSCEDSLAALSTDMEMDNEDGDKMGMRRAKELSEGLRKTCRKIATNNWVIACSNQIRVGKGGGTTTPGGKAVGFYASIRIALKPIYGDTKLEKTITIKRGKDKKKKVSHKKVIAVRTECEVKKTVDEPYGKCKISIRFGYGVDDVRENLLYIKQNMALDKFICPDGQEYSFVEDAAVYIEDNNLENELREQVIDLWEEIDRTFKEKTKRKKKVRR